MSNLIQAHKLSLGYDELVIKEASFTFKDDDFVFITGKSGSGKSTLLHILSSFLKPQSGKVSLFNLDIYALPQNEILALRRKKIGMIFQSHYLFLGFSAYENLQVASILSGEKIDESLLEMFGISETLNKNVGSLSGGQQQRLSIARILTKKPQIIFADEPTGNLDRETAFNVMETLFGYTKSTNSLLLFVTDDSLLAKKATRAYKLENTTLNPL